MPRKPAERYPLTTVVPIKLPSLEARQLYEIAKGRGFMSVSNLGRVAIRDFIKRGTPLR